MLLPLLTYYNEYFSIKYSNFDIYLNKNEIPRVPPEGARVPLVLRVPQFENHWIRLFNIPKNWVEELTECTNLIYDL